MLFDCFVTGGHLRDYLAENSVLTIVGMSVRIYACVRECLCVCVCGVYAC